MAPAGFEPSISSSGVTGMAAELRDLVFSEATWASRVASLTPANSGERERGRKSPTAQGLCFLILICVPSSHLVRGCHLYPGLPPPPPGLASVGLHAHPLYPFHHTPLKEATVPCTFPPPHKRPRLDPCTPIPAEVSQRIEISVPSPGAVPFSPSRPTAILHSLCLEPIPETVTEFSGDEAASRGSDTASTVSWAASSDGFSADVSDSRFF